MGDDAVSNEALWQEYIFELVRQKRAAGKSGDVAQREAMQEFSRMARGPGSDPDIEGKLQDRIADLKSRGMSGPRALYKVTTEHLNELKRTDAQRVEAFLYTLRKQRKEEREDQSLDTAKEIAVEGLWKSTGQKVLKDLWRTLRKDHSEKRTFLQFLGDTLRTGLEETGRATRDELIKQLQERSSPELTERSEKAFGLGSPHLSLQDLMLMDGMRHIDQDFFSRLELGKDADRALERMGMIEVRNRNVFEAGEQPLELTPAAGRDFDLDWDLKPKGKVKLKLDKIAKQGLTPDVFGKAEVGAALKLKYQMDHVTLRAELEADGELDLKDLNKWRPLFGRDYLERNGKAKAAAKLGAEIRPDANLTIAVQANIQTDIDRNSLNWSAGGAVNLQYQWGNNDTKRARREKLLSADHTSPWEDAPPRTEDSGR